MHFIFVYLELKELKEKLNQRTLFDSQEIEHDKELEGK